MVKSIHCLVLIRSQGGSGRALRRSLFPSGLKGYVLLPRVYLNKCPKVSDLFLQNDLQIINDELEYPSVKNVRFEIIEILLTGNSSSFLTVCAEEHNKEVVGLLLGRNSTISFVAHFYGRNITSAVDEGNKKVVTHLLNHQVDIRYRHSVGGTVLHMAVMRGDEAFVKLLLRCGANIDAEQSDGATCLHIATGKDSAQMVRMLIRYGANVNKKMHDGRTPLLKAILGEKTQIVEYLLQNGADVKEVYTFIYWLSQDAGVKGGTALHAAIANRDYSITQLLLKHGAEVDAQCEDGRTCLQLAVDSGMVSIVEEVLNYCPDISNQNNRKSFSAAVILNIERGKYFDREIVSRLFEYGFRTSSDDADNYKLLLTAIYGNFIEVVQQLLDHGALVKACKNGSQREQLLTVGAAYAGENMVKLLLDIGIDVNNPMGDYYYTPLYAAVKSLNLNNVKLLLERGAKVFTDMTDIGNWAQFKLIFFASFSSEILETILKHGADVTASNSERITTLYFCARNLSNVEMLLKFGACVDILEEKDTPLHSAIEKACLEVFEVLLNYCFFDPKLHENLSKDPEYFSGLETIDGGLDILSRHQMKHACACSVNEQFLSGSLVDFKSSCLEEIEKLKFMQVGNSELTFFAVMFGDLYSVSVFAKNESVVQTIVSEEFKKEFPIYGDVIKWQFWRGYYRRKLLQRGIEVCLLLSKRFSSLPDADLLLEKILNNLSNRELLYLISDRSIICDPLF